MSNFNKNTNFESYKSVNSDDELDFKYILNFLTRNKLFISAFSISFFFLGLLYSLTIRRVWQGQFQIVLDLETKDPTSIIPFSGLSSNKSSLKTEVGILRSPSVLMPVFESIVSKKENNSRNFYNFSNWKSNLNIGLEKGTSILNITYRDTEKERIIPVLEKMSSSYQQYSGKKVRRSQEVERNYLKSQISIFKEKSSNSLKTVQNYALDQDLVYFDTLPSLGGTSNDINNIEDRGIDSIPLDAPNLLLPNVGIENLRVDAANQIRKIDLQVEKLNNLSEDVYELIYLGSKIPILQKEGLPEKIKQGEDRLLTINNQLKQIELLEDNNWQQLQYIGSTIPALVAQNLPSTLEDIESELVMLKSKYTEQDQSIIRTLSRRELTIDLLKERVIKYLNAEKAEILASREPLIKLLKSRTLSSLKASKLDALAIMQSAMRPKGVLLKYKELIREAGSDEATLISLENQLRRIELTIAKEQDPWELITKPILRIKPIAPSRIQIGLYGLLVGIFLSGVFSFYKEKKSNLIFEDIEFEKQLKIKYLEKFILSSLYENSDSFLLFKEFVKSQEGDIIHLISLGLIQKEDLNKFKDNLIKDNEINKKVVIINSYDQFKSFKKSDINILFSSIGLVNYSEFNYLKKYLKIFKLTLSGVVLIKDEKQNNSLLSNAKFIMELIGLEQKK